MNKKVGVVYDLIYSDVDKCYIAIPHFNKESVKEHYDRINIGSSGLSGSTQIKTKLVVDFLKKNDEFLLYEPLSRVKGN